MLSEKLELVFWVTLLIYITAKVVQTYKVFKKQSLKILLKVKNF